MAQAKEQRVEMVGPDRLLIQLTKRVLNTALEEETAEHLGYDKHDPVGRNRGNSLNGARAKTVLTEIGRYRSRCPGTPTGASPRKLSRNPNAAHRGR